MQTALIIIYFAGIIGQIIVRAPYARKNRSMEKTKGQTSASEQATLAVLTIGGFILPLVYVFTDWLAFADYPFSASFKTTLGVVGVVILGPALWLFWRAHRDLGVYWSPTLELRANHQLITNGVYNSIRHPMYASQLLFGISQAFLLQNWIAGLGGLLSFLLLYFLRVPKEEAMMLAQFGDQYRDYCQRSGRILPRVGGQVR